MSIGVKINENYISKKFRPVYKVKVKNQGEGTSLWIPVSRIDVDEKTITKNGFYYAVDDSVDGYWQVNVNVSTEMDDDDKQSGKTVSGKGSDGDDYSYGTEKDEETGEEYLTQERIPSAIHIVVPPTKRHYYGGETIDFSGIHVYLLDGHNNLLKTDSYPTGEIPFDELIFPVTSVDGIGQREWSGNGINGIELNYSEYDVYDYSDPPKPTGNKVWLSEPIANGEDRTFVIGGGTGSAKVIATQYNNVLYAVLLEGSNNRVDLYDDSLDRGVYRGRSVTSLRLSNYFANTSYRVGGHGITELTVPESTADPSGKTTEGLTPSGDTTIPVQWVRPSDGKTLEDTFAIIIGGGQDEEQSDPYSGSYDVEYGGHHYNINHAIVPTVHYANGYCWQEGTQEYTVEQAVGFGWLIRLGDM